MEKKKLNLSLSADIIRKAKYQAIAEGRDVSDIVADLLRGYLDKVERAEAKQKK